MKFNKSLLITGTIIAIVAPTTTSLSCSTSITPKHYKLLPTYTGQADQLLALGIAPDYYPWQLNVTHAYEYLTNPKKYMSRQPQKFQNAFQNKLTSLFNQIEDQGRTWWNQMAQKRANANPNPEYWTSKSGDLTLYEHYLLDDEIKVITSDKAPSYDAAIQTNFRWSQDPFTRLSKAVIENSIDTKDIDGTVMADYEKNISKEIQKVFGLRDSQDKIVESMWTKDEDGEDVAKFDDESKWDTNAKLFNDAIFAYSYHTQFMDNPLLQPGGIAENFNNFIMDGSDGKQKWIFNADPEKDKILRDMFEISTLSPEQKSMGLNSIAYHSAHHPIYDAQTEIGMAPVYEGARRENMLYLYNLASQLTHVVNGQNAWGEEGSQHQKDVATILAKDFEGDNRLEMMSKALENANSIAGNLDTRLNAIKKYFKTIGAEGKTIALTTIAPGGGVSTIQTNSKYSFLFERLGLNYAMPTHMLNTPVIKGKEIEAANDALNAIKIDVMKGQPTLKTIFSMDDNGWFWNIGEGNDELANAAMFHESSDLQILTIRNLEWDGMTLAEKETLAKIQKTHNTVENLSKQKVDYDLWNEGLKTPFVINMILDDVITRIEGISDQIKINSNDAKTELQDALNWGDYWTKTYIE